MVVFERGKRAKRRVVMTEKDRVLVKGESGAAGTGKQFPGGRGKAQAQPTVLQKLLAIYYFAAAKRTRTRVLRRRRAAASRHLYGTNSDDILSSIKILIYKEKLSQHFRYKESNAICANVDWSDIPGCEIRRNNR